MNKTRNYQLNQWELHDRVMMQDFNADNAKIDAALKAEADARAAADAAIKAEFAKFGNCRVEAFTYTGTGIKGTEQTRRIAFAARPVWMVIMGGGNILWASGMTERQLFLGRYAGVNNQLTLTNTDLKWEGNTAVLGSADPATRMDSSGTYGVIALFAEDAK